MERKKATLACRRFKGSHIYDSIATRLDNTHSGIFHKITSKVTDNGSNFIKAFKRYPPVEEYYSEDNEDEVTFIDNNDTLQKSVRKDDEDGVITLPPHQRCASHTLNLLSCPDINKSSLSST